jgi:hypothetical protein
MGWLLRSVLVALLALIAFGFYVLVEPVSIFGYDGDALAESLEGEAPDDYGKAECIRQGESWRCSIEVDAGSGFGASYRVTADDDGCWDARPIRYGKGGIPRDQTQESACVGVLDLIGLDLFEI